MKTLAEVETSDCREAPIVPDCECHGEPMWWHAAYTRRGGGWRCSVKERERSRRRYWDDPVADLRRSEERQRGQRISRMTDELKELLNA